MIAEAMIAYSGLVTVMSYIAKLTPTEVDNKVVYYMLKFADFFALSTKPTELKKPPKPPE